MLSRIKKRCLANPVVNFVIPAVFSLGKGVASMGLTLFGMIQFLEKLTGEKNSAISIPLSLITTSATFTLTCFTRIPAIFDKFSSKNEEEAVSLPYHFRVRNFEELDLIKEEEDEERNRLGCCAHIFIHTFTLVGVVSGTFASLSALLGTKTLMEFILNQTSELIYNETSYNETSRGDPYEDAWKENLINAFALFIAFSNLMSFFSYNVEDVTNNVKSFVLSCKNGSWEIHIGYACLTALISAPVLISSPFVANFSTSHALRQLPFKLSDPTIKYLGITSSSIKLTTDLLTFPRTTYEFLTKMFLSKTNSSDNRINTKCQMAIANVTLAAGGVDSFAEGCKTYVGVLSTLQLFKILPDYPLLLMAFSAMCGGSAVASNMTFGVRKGVLQFLDRRSEPMPIYYQRLPMMDEDMTKDVELNIQTANSETESSEEASGESAEPQDINYVPSSSTLFQPRSERELESSSNKKRCCVIF